jgi:phosphoribosyl 1,2-cyclic phosphate phosphodiesterase
MQQMDMPIYARQPVMDQLKREFAYIFTEAKYPGIPMVELHLIENKSFEVQGQKIVPVEVMHHEMSVLGFRFGDFTYITDTNHISDEEKKKIKGSKVLVLNALQHQPHISHFTLKEALAVIAELEPEKAYLTHISHRLGKHRDVRNTLPDNVELAWDGLQLELN